MSVDLAKPSTRQILLETAEKEIYRHGYQGAGIDAILAQTKSTKGALYHHFSSKAELAYAVVDERVGPFILRRWLSPLTLGDPIQAMQAILGQFIHANRDDLTALGCPLNNLAQEMCPLDEGFRVRIERIYLDWRNGIAQALSAGQSRGHVRGDVNPDGVALFIVSAVEGSFGVAKASQDSKVLASAFQTLSDYLTSLRPPQVKRRSNG